MRPPVSGSHGLQGRGATFGSTLRGSGEPSVILWSPPLFSFTRFLTSTAPCGCNRPRVHPPGRAEPSRETEPAAPTTQPPPTRFSLTQVTYNMKLPKQARFTRNLTRGLAVIAASLTAT